MFQNRKSFIGEFAPAIATCRIQVGAAMGTKPSAGLRAERFKWNLEQNLFEDRCVQIDYILLVVREIEICRAQLHILLRQGRGRRERIMERGLKRQMGRFKATTAGHLRGGRNASFEKDIFFHPPDGAGDVNPVKDEPSLRSCLRQALLEPFSIPFESEVYSPLGDVADVDLQKIPFPLLKMVPPPNGELPNKGWK